MRRLGFFTICIAGGLAIVVALGGALREGLDGKPPIPPLLQNLKAVGGWLSVCPAREAWETKLHADQPTLKSELNIRLAEHFPSGSDEAILIAALKNQNFTLENPCAFDPTIHQAEFHQTTGLTPATAEIFWKVDNSGLIIWTKGRIFYGGL